MPSDGPLRKLVGWIDAGVSRCAGAGGDGRRRPFPTALVLAGGAPLGCLAALFRKLDRRHSCDILPADALFFVWSRRKGLMGVKREP